jgi:hypothetical protein
MASFGVLLERFNLEFLSEATTGLLLFRKHLHHASIVRLQGVKKNRAGSYRHISSVR